MKLFEYNLPVSVSVDVSYSVNKPLKEHWNNNIKLTVFNLFNTIISCKAVILNIHTEN